MLEIFLGCSAADREVAAAIATRLETAAEATVLIDDSDSGTVESKWECGLSSAGILLLLSPDSVPSRVSRTDWGAMLDHISHNAEPPVGSVLVRPCGYPRMLDRKHFFPWENDPRRALRAIQEWVVSLHRLPDERSFVPARLPWFEGRAAELELLWETLVDRPGIATIVNPAAASGKTSLAQEFCRRAAAYFRDILWIDCADGLPASIAANLAEQTGAHYQNDSAEALTCWMDVAGQHRVLIVFDDLPTSVTIPDLHGRASVLVTARSAPAKVSPPQVIRIDPSPTVTLNSPIDPVDLRLWRAMAVCRPGAFPLDLAARIAGLDSAESSGACTRLIQSRLVDPVDETRGWMRCNPSARAAMGDPLEVERRIHAEIIEEAASEWRTKPDFRQRYFAEWLPAFRWAAAADWPLACKIVRHAIALLRHDNRATEAAELLMMFRDAADQRGDWQVSDECSWELSWIRGLPYRGPAWAPTDGDQLNFDFG